MSTRSTDSGSSMHGGWFSPREGEPSYDPAPQEPEPLDDPSGLQDLPPLEAGDVVADRYQVVEMVGQGGFARVYRAEDLNLPREVALKELKRPGSCPEDVLLRFYNEPKQIAKLDHPQVIKVIEVAEEPGRGPIIVMEFLPNDLENYIESRPGGKLPVQEAAGILAGIASALAAAHKQGIIHRDVKPRNVLLTRDGYAKLTDFGIAQSATLALSTQFDAKLGTFEYMAPEAKQSAKGAIPQSDVYSLGVTLYRCVTGAQPSSIVRIEKAPAEARLILDKCLQDDPEDRYQTADEVEEALHELSGGEVRPTVTAPSRLPLYIAIAAICILVGVVAVVALRGPGQGSATAGPIEAPEPTPTSEQLESAKAYAQKMYDETVQGSRRGQVNRAKRAVTAIRAVLALDPNDPDAQRMLSDIKNLRSVSRQIEKIEKEVIMAVKERDSTRKDELLDQLVELAPDHPLVQ